MATAMVTIVTMDDIGHIDWWALLANLSLVIRARYSNMFVRYETCVLCWKKVVCVLQI
jgi:hypothetical protein